MRLTMMHGDVFRPDDHPSLTGLAIYVKVWNPSAEEEAIVGWRMWAGGVEARRSELPSTLVLNGPGNMKAISPDSSLFAKTEEAMIGKRPVNGYVLFYAEAAQETVMGGTVRLEAELGDGLRVSEERRLRTWEVVGT